MAGGGSHNIDVVRKSGIVGLLIGAMVILHQFGGAHLEVHSAFDPTGMLALGFVILASYTFGQLVEVVKLPHITGYLLAGLCLGALPIIEHGHVVREVANLSLLLPEWAHVAPFDKGILNSEVIRQLTVFDTLAVALIALTAGGELKVSTLRRGLAQIMGVLSGQILVLFAIIPLFLLAITGYIPFIGHEGLSSTGWGLTGTLLVGSVLASISLATSPAATIAVVNSTRAKGPMTSTVMSAVVLKDVVVVVCFSVLSAVTISTLGLDTGAEGNVALLLTWEILGAFLIGALLGVFLALYLRFVNAEILLFLVGAVFTSNFIAVELHLDIPLMYIAAGFVASNLFKEGDELIHQVERLSLPVYVVFFTLAGAKLHLDALWEMLPYAIALVALRGLGIFVGVWGGAKITAAEANTRRYGWLGFLSQAGVAITLAKIVGQNFGETGPTLETLIIAGVAINEIAGPVALKVALSLAGEIGGSDPDHGDEDPQEPREETEEGPTPAPASAHWQAEATDENPWAGALRSESAALQSVLDGLLLELPALATGIREGPFVDFEESASEYLSELRRAFLRFHRRIVVQTRRADDAEQLTRIIRRQKEELAGSWREIVLRRAAAHGDFRWDPMEVVAALDALAQAQPVTIDVPFDEQLFDSAPGDSPITRAGRLVLRARRSAARVAGGTPSRTVAVQQLVRYHLSGVAPRDLESIPALLLSAEHHLANRTRSLFESAHRGYAALIRDVIASGDREAWGRAAAAVGSDVEDEMAIARTEIRQIVEDGAFRTAHVLGAALGRIRDELPLSNSPALSGLSRRFNRVYALRNQGVRALTEGVTFARDRMGAEYGLLALELEVIALETSVSARVEDQAAHLARRFQGRTVLQLERIVAALGDAMPAIEASLADPTSTTSQDLRSALEPVERTLAAASEEVASLLDEIRANEFVGTIISHLEDAAQRLTEHYRVPADPEATAEWRLPERKPDVSIPFRQAVVTYIETTVSQALLSLTQTIEERASVVYRFVSETRRSLSFNLDMAASELDYSEAQQAEPPATVVQEMVLGPLGRSSARAERLLEESRVWPIEAETSFRAAALEDLARLRGDIVGGQLSTLRAQEMVTRRRQIAQDASELGERLQEALVLATDTVRHVVGERQLEELRTALGIPTSDASEGSPVFRPRASSVPIPAVYERLFTDTTSGMADLVAERTESLRRAVETLQSGTRRTVAVAGEGRIESTAFVEALIRGIRAQRIERLERSDQLDQLDRDRPTLFIVPELRDILGQNHVRQFRRLAERLQHAAPHQWVVVSTPSVWRQLESVAGARAAFDEWVDLAPLTQEEMQSALLTRHSMSGYAVRFRARPSGLLFSSPSLRARETLEDQSQESWLHDLYRASDGSLDVAQHLWLSAIEEIDESSGTIHLGPLPELPDRDLRTLPEFDRLTLRLVMLRGRIGATAHARAFRLKPNDSLARLRALENIGLLVSDEDRFELSRHVVPAVRRVLRGAGWL